MDHVCSALIVADWATNIQTVDSQRKIIKVHPSDAIYATVGTVKRKDLTKAGARQSGSEQGLDVKSCIKDG